MSLLLVSEIFPPRTGGSGRWFWEVYRRLPRPDVVVAAGEHPRQDDFDRGHDLRVRRLPLAMAQWGLRSRAGLAGYWSGVRRLRKLIKSERIREIHCGRCLPEGFLAWLLHKWVGLPYLCYVHGEDVGTASTSRELAWMVRRVLGSARLLVANSLNTQGMLLRDWGVSEQKVQLLYPGVDTERFAPAPPDPEARRRLGWDSRRVVLTVGRLQTRKGHDTMIRALPRIARVVPDVLYAVCGDGEERPRLEELCRASGVANRVRFLGEPDDATLVTCYQQCDLFVLPNRAVGRDVEGFGMVLLEAQACGKAVVAGASGGTAETMRVPATGRIVPCDGPDELAAVVGELLSDPVALSRMGEAGRRWVAERFDWEALASQARVLFGLESAEVASPA